MKHKTSSEQLSHFNCGACDKWWSIADLPEGATEREWFCPWCGMKA